MSAKAIKTTIAATWAVFATLLAACAGGSGSSGFLSEAAVIQDVLDTGECMLLDGLEICPAGVAPTPTPTGQEAQPTTTPTPTATHPTDPTPEPTDTVAMPQQTETPPPSGTVEPTTDFQTPTATPSDTATATSVATATFTRTAVATASPTATTVPFPSVDVAPAPIFAVDCSAFALSGPCLVLQIQPSGFPPGSAFYLASRRQDSQDVWVLTPASPDTDVPQGSAPLYDAAVPLPPEIGMDGSDALPLQIVVLAYFDPPSSVPADVDRLADSGADQAFAVAPLFF